MNLIGARTPLQVEGMERLPGKSNYFVGNDPAKWRTNVPNYAKVTYRNAYPGIDLVYYGNQRQLEFDFQIAPGADPNLIQIEFDGADSMELDRDGNLVLSGYLVHSSNHYMLGSGPWPPAPRTMAL